jgi:hypothetical protein
MTFPLKEGAPVRKTAEFRTDHGQPDAAPSFNGFLASLQRLSAAARYKAEWAAMAQPIHFGHCALQKVSKHFARGAFGNTASQAWANARIRTARPSNPANRTICLSRTAQRGRPAREAGGIVHRDSGEFSAWEHLYLRVCKMAGSCPPY